MWLKSLSYEVYSYMQLMLDCNFFLIIQAPAHLNNGLLDGFIIICC